MDPASGRYSALIEELETSAKTVRDRGVQIAALDNTIAELKRHTANIQALEERLGAVRDEVIAPIKKTLDENKRAGWFSIYGFWVGLLSIIISTGGVLYTVYTNRIAPVLLSPTGHPQPTADAIAAMQRDLSALTLHVVGITSDYKPTEGEVLLRDVPILENGKLVYQDRKTLLRSPDSTIDISLAGTYEDDADALGFLPSADVSLLLNGRVMRDGADPKVVTIVRNQSAGFTKTSYFASLARASLGIRVYEGDRLTLLGKYSFDVARVFRTRSHILPVGDDFKGVLLKPVK